MVCNLGYKSYARVTIPTTQKFQVRTLAPQIEADLLAKCGADPNTLSALQSLNFPSLLSLALQRTLLIVPVPSDVSVTIQGSMLDISNPSAQNSQIAQLNVLSSRLTEQFQLQVLNIVAELLDYKTKVTGLVLEGEKETDNKVHQYLRINLAQGTWQFEHFASSEGLSQEQSKFQLLAAKMGLELQISDRQEEGSPISEEIEHRHFFGHSH